MTDSAPLVMAEQLGFFSELGLNVRLSQEVSWAAVRDKLATGALDIAQMLMPLPAMTTLGLSGLRSHLLNSLVLTHNGNAITVSDHLMRSLKPFPGGDPIWVPDYSSFGNKPTLAIVHAFSTHHLLLRRWLRMGGIDPDNQVTTIVVPPSQMIDSLTNGLIDGYCVGEPWNTLAALQGSGHIAAAGVSIWPDAPEKVLSTTHQWQKYHPNTHLLIQIALLKANEWLGQYDNALSAVEVLADNAYLDLPRQALTPSLSGRMKLGNLTTETLLPDFHRFNADEKAIPRINDAKSLMVECTELLGRTLEPALIEKIALQSARPDLAISARKWLSETSLVAP